MSVDDGSRYFSQCTKCGGSGVYSPPPVNRGGGSWSQEMPGTCNQCAGTGALPTIEGAEILRLIQRFSRHGRIEIPDIVSS